MAADQPAAAIGRRLIGVAVNRSPVSESQAATAPVWRLDQGRFVDDRPRLAKRHGDALLESVAALGSSPRDRRATVAAAIAAFADAADRPLPRRIFVASTASDNEVVAALRQAGLPAIDVAPGATERGDGRFCAAARCPVVGGAGLVRRAAMPHPRRYGPYP